MNISACGIATVRQRLSRFRLPEDDGELYCKTGLEQSLDLAAVGTEQTYELTAFVGSVGHHPKQTSHLHNLFLSSVTCILYVIS